MAWFLTLSAAPASNCWMLPWTGFDGCGKSGVGPVGGVGGFCVWNCFFLDSLKSENVPRVGIFLFLRPGWIFFDLDLRRWMVLPLFSVDQNTMVSGQDEVLTG